MAKSITQRNKFIIFGVALVIILVALGWLGWTKYLVNSDKVLSGAIENSLKTNSVTRKVVQDSQGSGVDQTTYLSFYQPDPNAYTNTVLSQLTSNGQAKVQTETIGTNDADYVRYTSVEGAGGSDGAGGLKSLIGVWAKRGGENNKDATTTFFNEGLFSVVPFGNVNSEQRANLLNQIKQKNLYKVISAEKKFENKRLVYEYDLSINPADLVEILKSYMQLSGNGDASQINPDEYKGSAALNIKMTIDVVSREILSISYPQGRVESYSGYGLYRPTNLPTETIPAEELQKRLSQPQS